MIRSCFLLCALCFVNFLYLCAQPPSCVPTAGLQLWCGFTNNALTQQAEPTSGTTVVSNEGATFQMDRAGNPLSAMDFDTTTDKITINCTGPNPTPFVGGGTALAVNVWFKVSRDHDQSIIAQCWDETTLTGWKIEWHKQSTDTSYIHAQYSNPGIASCSVEGDISGDFFGWHMATFQVDASGAHLTIDAGTALDSAWDTNISMITAGFLSPVILGNSNGVPSETTAFQGKIDDFGIWDQALTTTQISTLFSCVDIVSGCINSNACNYNNAMTIDDGSCNFDCQGCMDPCACNYDQNATQNLSQFCVYNCLVDSVLIRAFLDLDIDGIYDPEETPLAHWPIYYHNNADSAIVATDSQGEYLLPVVSGDYTFEIDSLSNGASGWGSVNNVLQLLQSRTFPNSPIDTILFGFAPPASAGTHATASIVQGNWDDISCSSGYGSGLFVTNTGAEILYGQITLTCDGVFMPGADSSLTIGPDSVSLGYAEWNIDSLMPGASALYTFHVDAGDSTITNFSFDMHVDLHDANAGSAIPATSADYTIVPGIDCSPQQPGNVNADPVGAFTPDNIILSGEEIIYNLKFRNIGPGILDSLRVSINLNADVFDLASLAISYVSEDYTWCLHDDGTLELRMNQMLMPDTASDPVGSMGYVQLRATTYAGLPSGTEVVLDPQLRGICLHDNGSIDLQVLPVTIPVERYVHHIFDCNAFSEPIAISNNESHSILDNGNLPVLINPLNGTDFIVDACQDTTNNLDVYAQNYLWVFGNDTITTGCQITLATEGANEVSDILPSTLIISNPICADTTNFTIVIPVEEIDASQHMQVYPNPFSTQCNIVFTERFKNIVLYNSVGEIIQTWSNAPTSITIDRRELRSGVYHLVAQSERSVGMKILIAE